MKRLKVSIAIEQKGGKQIMAIPSESAAQRFVRFWGSMSAERKTRGLDNQSDERQARLFVSPTGVSATGKTRP